MIRFRLREGLLLALLATQTMAQTGSWRRFALPGSSEMVTAVAIDRGTIALGLSTGGVEILTSSLGGHLDVRDPLLGARERVHSLAFASDRLWIASEGGLFSCDPATGELDKSRKSVPTSVRTGVSVLMSRGDALWCATNRSLAVLPTRGSDGFQEWKMPIDDTPTSLLQVGSKILVGTNSSGLLVLDSATGSWIRLGTAEGLSSDQVTAMEQVGAEAFLATPEGVDVLDLSSQKVQPLVARFGAFWMTQVNGSLRLSSAEGLLDLDATTRRASPATLPAGVKAEGAIAYGDGLLVIGCGAEVLVREVRTLLGDEPLRLDRDGFRLRLPAKLPQGNVLQAFLRLPEWLDSRFPVVVETAGDGTDVLLRIPSDLRGLVQIDVSVSASGKVAEIRSLTGIADRGLPTLRLDPASAIVKDSTTSVTGKVLGVGPFVLVGQPGGVAVSIGRDGSFRSAFALKPGSNRFSMELADGLGNATSREFTVSRDADAPVFGAIHVDTVSGDFARIRVPYRDDNPVQATTRSACLARASVFDSFVILEARKLSVGENSIELQLLDQAGNRGTASIKVVRRNSSASLEGGYRPAEEILASTDPPWGAKAARWDGLGSSVHILHYRMIEGETLCGVAEKFYGTQPLAEILIRWNGFADSSQWRRMPVGTPVDVPFWTDFDFGKLDQKEALATFPWALLPSGPRNRK